MNPRVFVSHKKCSFLVDCNHCGKPAFDKGGNVYVCIKNHVTYADHIDSAFFEKVTKIISPLFTE